MARSKNGCFNILACAGNSGDADADGAHLEENKAPSDKSRWNFRRRSTRQSSVKNTEVCEPATYSCNKGNSDVVTVNNICSPPFSYGSEKPLHQEKPNEHIVPPCTETKSEEAATEVAEESKAVAEQVHVEGANKDLVEAAEENHLKAAEQQEVESAAIVIQSGIKAYMARQELSNQQSIVKLQAVIRGHMVRRQAAGTLRCLLAIIKTQALVRARQACQSLGTPAIQEYKIIQENAARSSEKLLLNGFAHKMMNTMPTSKTIHIKCDPSNSDVVWKWFERWTTLVPPTTGDLLEHSEDVKLADEIAGDNIQNEDKTVSTDNNLSSSNSVPSKCTESLTDNADIPEAVLSFSDDCLNSSVKDDLEMKLVENDDEGTKQEGESKMERDLEMDSFLNQSSMQTEPTKEPSFLSENAESYCDNLANDTKNEQPVETEEKKFATKKSCNPAFAAAQLRFEELSSNSSVSKPANSSHQDTTSKFSSLHSQEDVSAKGNNDTGFSKNPAAHDARVLVAASECGTEISISSTLDSPDTSEHEGGEIVLEIGASENRNYATGNAATDANLEYAEVKSSSNMEVQNHGEEQKNGNLVDSVLAADPVQVEQPQAELHEQFETSIETPGKHVKSPEGTPRSRTTITESYGTPSSQVSVNTKKSKRENNVPTQRQKPHPLNKKSLSSPSSDSVGRSSTDNLSKGSKNIKRDGSSRVPKPDNADQEPRISNSNPLPSYMQFTESARAKTAASLSPKLSPDVQDNQAKKRHSLPIGNGKQESSPRMQRSTSQAQQNSKGNGTDSQNSSERWQI